MWKTWRAFWRLSASRKYIAMDAAVLLLITWIGLRLVGFRRWKDWLERSAVSAAPGSADTSGAAISLARLEETVARHLPFRTNCLENSFALYWLLRRNHVPAKLRIGARKIDARLEAHAWLESQGIVLGNTDHLPFVPFDGLNATMESRNH